MKSLFKTVALITFFSFLTRVAGFIFRIILSRIIGAEGLGLYQVASSIFMVLLTIISSGIPLIISRTSAKFHASGDKKKEGSFITISLIFTLSLSIVISLVVLLCKGLFAKVFTDERCISILIVLLPSLVFSSVYCVLRGAMWGKGNYFALCITEFYEQIVRIFLALLLIDVSFSAIKNAFNLGLSLSIACIFSMLLVIILYFFYGGKMGSLKKGYLKPFIKQSTPITIMRVVSSFIQPIIALIIPARLMAIGYTSSQALSLYGIAVGMTMPLLFVPTTIIGSLSTALIPDISKAIALNDKNHVEKRVSSSLFFALFVSALFVPVFLSLGEQIGVFLYNDILSGTLLQSACWVLIPLGLTNISSGLLNSIGLENKAFINFAISAVVMLLCLWFLPLLFGINALMWSLGINYLMTATLNLWLLKRHTKIRLNIFKPLFKLVLISIPCGALTSFVASLCSYVFPLFITLAIGGIICLTSFTLLCWVFNIIDVRAFMIRAGNGIKSKIPKMKKSFSKGS